MSFASTTALVAVTGFFAGSAIAITLALGRLRLARRQKYLLIATILISLAGKIALARVGTQVDVNAYKIFAGLIEQGKSVYAGTPDYNYAPVWAWITSGLDRLGILMQVGTGHGFHMMVAAFLSVVDVLLALVLVSEFSYGAGIVYLLSPVGFGITGFLAQFDNLALLVALLAWLILRKSAPSKRMLILSAVLVGISLTIKHDAFLFPAWLVFWKPLGKLWNRILYAVIAYGIFFGSFLPWWGDPASRASIFQNVFGYNSAYGRSLLGQVTGLIVSIEAIDKFFHWVPVISGFKLLWIVLMMGVGWVIARRDTKELFLCYLLALFAFLPSVFVSYMVIAMIACAILYRWWPSWAFLICATGTMVVAAVIEMVNDGTIPAQWFHNISFMGRSYNWDDTLNVGWVIPLTYASQLCAIVLLAFLCRPKIDSGTDRPMPARAKLFRATALVAAGSIPWVLITAVKKVWLRG